MGNLRREWVFFVYFFMFWCMFIWDHITVRLAKTWTGTEVCEKFLAEYSITINAFFISTNLKYAFVFVFASLSSLTLWEWKMTRINLDTLSAFVFVFTLMQ